MSDVQPYEARNCPMVPNTVDGELTDLVTAVNGFVYAGGNLDTIVLAVRWLRANPDTARTLLDLEA